MEEGTEGCSRPLRADARKNRARLLAAAEEVFAEQGVSVPIDDVAQRAGVGVGTLYRHFPTKEALFVAVVATRFENSCATSRGVFSRLPIPVRPSSASPSTWPNRSPASMI